MGNSIEKPKSTYTLENLFNVVVEENNLEKAKEMLETHKLDVNKTVNTSNKYDVNSSILHYLMSKEDISKEMVELLLHHKADVNYKNNYNTCHSLFGPSKYIMYFLLN